MTRTTTSFDSRSTRAPIRRPVMRACMLPVCSSPAFSGNSASLSMRRAA
ncbi:hypothetical protein SCE1572_38525 [Sorangium cellulosum So0157-2]|uniref:Uncharacterized protein n=1 Tax=Sorangium cellulosum So0157-2 TaxID=1254432 RepID=S4Y322_SORCE|nr:hypothetical protein SCE1572_38525 [Sorangium cellulosum So0157-2]